MTFFGFSKRFSVMIKTCLEHGGEPQVGGKWRIRNSWTVCTAGGLESKPVCLSQDALVSR